MPEHDPQGYLGDDDLSLIRQEDMRGQNRIGRAVIATFLIAGLAISAGKELAQQSLRNEN